MTNKWKLASRFQGRKKVMTRELGTLGQSEKKIVQDTARWG